MKFLTVNEIFFQNKQNDVHPLIKYEDFYMKTDDNRVKLKRTLTHKEMKFWLFLNGLIYYFEAFVEKLISFHYDNNNNNNEKTRSTSQSSNDKYIYQQRNFIFDVFDFSFTHILNMRAKLDREKLQTLVKYYASAASASSSSFDFECVFSLDNFIDQYEWKTWMNENYHACKEKIDNYAKLCSTTLSEFFISTLSFRRYHRSVIFPESTATWGRPIWFFRHMLMLNLELKKFNQYSLMNIVLGMRAMIVCLPCSLCIHHVYRTNVFEYMNYSLQYTSIPMEINNNRNNNQQVDWRNKENIENYLKNALIFKEFLLHNFITKREHDIFDYIDEIENIYL